MIQIIENAQVEWDVKRGVLYVHNKDTGATVIRVCGLEKSRTLDQLKDGQIDITNPKNVSYPEDSL